MATRQIDPAYLVFMQENPGKHFCDRCLARRSPARVTETQKDAYRNKSFSEGQGQCSECGALTRIQFFPEAAIDARSCLHNRAAARGL